MILTVHKHTFIISGTTIIHLSFVAQLSYVTLIMLSKYTIYIFNNQILLYIYNLITKNAIPMSIHYCFQQYGLPFVLTFEDQLFHLTLPG